MEKTMFAKEKTIFTERDAARFLSVSEGTLSNWRSRKKGPLFSRLGRIVRYRKKDLEAFKEETNHKGKYNHPRNTVVEASKSNNIEIYDGESFENEHFNETSAADYLALTRRTLRNWRYAKEGPAYVKVGRYIRYRKNDLNDYIDRCMEHIEVQIATMEDEGNE